MLTLSNGISPARFITPPVDSPMSMTTPETILTVELHASVASRSWPARHSNLATTRHSTKFPRPDSRPTAELPPNCSLDSVRIRSRTAAQGLERPLHCLPPRVHACVEMNHPWYCRRPRRLCQGTWPLVRASSPAPNRPSNRVRHVSCALMDNHGHHHSFVALSRNSLQVVDLQGCFHAPASAGTSLKPSSPARLVICLSTRSRYRSS